MAGSKNANSHNQQWPLAVGRTGVELRPIPRVLAHRSRFAILLTVPNLALALESNGLRCLLLAGLRPWNPTASRLPVEIAVRPKPDGPIVHGRTVAHRSGGVAARIACGHGRVIAALAGAISSPALRQPSISSSVYSPIHHCSRMLRATEAKSGRSLSGPARPSPQPPAPRAGHMRRRAPSVRPCGQAG